MKKLLLLLIFLSPELFGQSPHIAELKLNDLQDQCAYWTKENIDSLYFYASELEELAFTYSDTNALICARHYLGDVMLRKSYFSIAENYFLENQSFLSVYNDSMRNASNSLDLGRWYLAQVEVETAIPFFEKSFSIYESLDNKEGIILTKEHLLRCNAMLNHYDEAFRLGYEVKRLVFTYEISEERSTILNHLGKLHLEQEHTDSALYYFDRALEVERRLNVSLPRLADIYTNMAIANYYRGNLVQTEDLFYKALGYRMEFGEEATIRDAVDNLASFYYSMDDVDRKLKIYKEGLDFSIYSKKLKNAFYFAKSLRNVYREVYNKDSLARYIMVSDSLNDAWVAKQVQEQNKYNAHYYSLLTLSKINKPSMNEAGLNLFSWRGFVVLVSVFILGLISWRVVSQ